MVMLTRYGEYSLKILQSCDATHTNAKTQQQVKICQQLYAVVQYGTTFVLSENIFLLRCYYFLNNIIKT
jgi:hypothetical protein